MSAMMLNLTFGALVISLNVIVHTVGLVLLARWMSWSVQWFRLHRHSLGKTVAMVTTVLGLFAVHTVEVWIWAFAYLTAGFVNGLEEAVYFSTVTFSTLGYGDIIPPPGWRVFAALEAMNGFVLIGWSIAYLVAASTRHGPFRLGEHF
jgi:voltage-gated potassium channel Kch